MYFDDYSTSFQSLYSPMYNLQTNYSATMNPYSGGMGYRMGIGMYPGMMGFYNPMAGIGVGQFGADYLIKNDANQNNYYTRPIPAYKAKDEVPTILGILGTALGTAAMLLALRKGKKAPKIKGNATPVSPTPVAPTPVGPSAPRPAVTPSNGGAATVNTKPILNNNRLLPAHINTPVSTTAPNTVATQPSVSTAAGKPATLPPHIPAPQIMLTAQNPLYSLPAPVVSTTSGMLKSGPLPATPLPAANTAGQVEGVLNPNIPSSVLYPKKPLVDASKIKPREQHLLPQNAGPSVNTFTPTGKPAMLPPHIPSSVLYGKTPLVDASKIKPREQHLLPQNAGPSVNTFTPTGSKYENSPRWQAAMARIRQYENS